ncbi:MAG: SRPBCC domain-containing protein [Chloroflexota bacterium]
MDSNALSVDQKIMNKTVYINAPPSQVWHMLTNPELMKKWMMPDIELNIITTWKVGSPMIIRGNMGGKDFKNIGIVLQFEPERALQYSHLSSLSRLPDKPASYSIIEFILNPTEDQTSLTLTLSNFPTESIYKHLTFYWNVTLEVLKQMIEQQG